MPSKSAEQSGLIIPPGRVGSILQAKHLTRRKSKGVNVTVAASVQALAVVLLDAIAEECEKDGVKTAQRDHVRNAIVNNEALSAMFRNACFTEVNATPYISPAIMPAVRRKRSTKKSGRKLAED